MAKDVSDIVRDTVTRVVRDATDNLGQRQARSRLAPLSGMKGVAAGAGPCGPGAARGEGRRKAVRRRVAKGAVKDVAKKPEWSRCPGTS